MRSIAGVQRAVTTPRPSEDLRQMLIDAKLAGTRLTEGGYVFRSNEQAADAALTVFAKWLESKRAADGHAHDHA